MKFVTHQHLLNFLLKVTLDFKVRNGHNLYFKYQNENAYQTWEWAVFSPAFSHSLSLIRCLFNSYESKREWAELLTWVFWTHPTRATDFLKLHASSVRAHTHRERERERERERDNINWIKSSICEDFSDIL